MSDLAPREELVRILREESAFRARFKRRLWWILGTVESLAFLSAFYLGISQNDWSSMPNLLIFLLIGTVGAGFRPAHREAVKQLAERADPEVSAYLCELLDTEEAEMAQLVQETLLTALPRVREEDAPCFSDEQRREMTAYLVTTKNAPLAEAIVSCLGRIGTQKEIEPLEALRKITNGNLNADQIQRLENRIPMALADIRMREAKILIDRSATGLVAPAEVRDYAAGQSVELDAR